MRRFMSTVLFAAAALVGTLSLSGCIIEPPHRGHAGGYSHDHGWHGHDRDHDDRGHDHDHDYDHNHH